MLAMPSGRVLIGRRINGSGICADDCMLLVGRIFEVSNSSKVISPFSSAIDSCEGVDSILTMSNSGSALLNTPRVSLALLLSFFHFVIGIADI